MAKGRGRGGLRALCSSKCTGRPRKLTPAQERQVFRWVNGKRPDQYGFDFGLWTRQVVQELVLQRFEVCLSLASIDALLARLGLTAQKPLQRAGRARPTRPLPMKLKAAEPTFCFGMSRTFGPMQCMAKLGHPVGKLR